jgi:hypothetical protein
MIKQHGTGFIIFGYLILLHFLLTKRPLNYRNAALVFSLFSFSILLPFITTCLILWSCGVFEQFWFWTFDYARKYVAIMPLKAGIQEFKTNFFPILSSMPLLWILAAFGLLSITWNRNIRKYSLFLIGFLVCSFLAVCPGYYFREHYFMLLLPAVSILAGAAIPAFQNLFFKSAAKSAFVSALIVLAAWAHTFYIQKDYLLEKDPAKISRICFSMNGFPEMQQVAEFIKKRSSVSDKIAVLGSEPEIYFYAHRRSATSYLYMFPIMEAQPFALAMQKEMVGQIETSKPKYIVFVIRKYLSWLNRPKSVILIFDWLQQYLENYRQIAVVEVMSDKTIYHWDGSYVPSNNTLSILIYESNGSKE